MPMRSLLRALYCHLHPLVQLEPYTVEGAQRWRCDACDRMLAHLKQLQYQVERTTGQWLKCGGPCGRRWYWVRPPRNRHEPPKRCPECRCVQGSAA